ncbi:MAG: hypothetical protein UR39_C0001G0038 [Candidatus Woesebacteria bacterium GW2011_GWA1_33_30]|uniref:Uncharacterized protein n=1 Tax=Candidatus Woesebacteria bacterium GW2011_GWA2_33_28 TaxID=1618561 RepID=A0A0F9ZV11_9BACT|nr:MAG: hypothetical protein UR38_C0001G0039 [Candidatus Woesebacteria bacterium GW2011_GWA2_33_28]KKP49005.1 MAG: hypothetical protein UR39_C0001G0038 [Candidatus Woesebacteria bacterium GW2011_GWA1_33_30]KKP49887.1 MAG: hypothetical protein UR40_C0003G0059 [Microgenomates group bacterium GW2011_GWC1_33_32]KKP52597.1 MAG: hypothetical protein UR44_C0001G0039 [Candidatus Woesebacteria bacterium GW2011_GWB1_33_38]
MNQFIDTVLFLIVFMLFFIFPFTVKAAFSLAITSASPTDILDKEQIVEVTLQIEDLPSGDSYFRAGWKSGSSYVGYVQNNGGNWVELRALSGECSDYFKISEATTSAILKIKIGEENDISTGTIPIKAHRLTSSCSSSYGSNEFNTNILLPTSTPVPTTTSTPIVTAISTATATSTPIKTATSTPTKTATAKPTTTSTPTESGQAETPEFVVSDIKTSTPEGIVAGASTSKKFPFLSIFFIVAGIMFLGYGGYLIYNNKHGKTNEVS